MCLRPKRRILGLIAQYNTVIFETSVGMDHNTALLVAGFNGVAYFVSTLIPIWAIDRYVPLDCFLRLILGLIVWV